MEKKLPMILTLLLLISFAAVPATFAETEDNSVEVETMMEAESTSGKKMTLEERKATRETKMEEIKLERETRMEEAKQKREDLKAEIKAKREEAKTAIEAKREEFQAKLEAIKDEKKATIVERIDTRLAERNQRITDRLLGHLERISAIIDKMEDDLSNAPEGDTTKVDAAIASARGAVTTAEVAVVTQSGNSYIIELGEESELKTVVEATVNQFRTDMEVAITSVKVARDATQEAARALAAFRAAANPPKEEVKMEEKSADAMVEDGSGMESESN